MSKKLLSMVEQFKALAGGKRLKILSYLASGEKCVCHIQKHLALPQNLVSHHLGVLRQCGLILASRKGKWIYYTLNKKTITNLNVLLNRLLLSQKITIKC